MFWELTGVEEEEGSEEAAVAGSVAMGGTPVPVPQFTGHITTPQVAGHPAREAEPHWVHFTDGNREAQRDSATHSHVRPAGLACGGGEVADFPEKSRPHWQVGVGTAWVMATSLYSPGFGWPHAPGRGRFLGAGPSASFPPVQLSSDSQPLPASTLSDKMMEATSCDMWLSQPGG